MASSVGNEIRVLDPYVWKACAGSTVQTRTIGSRVYYFTEGHAEQASSPPDFADVVCLKPWVLCRIVSVHFLANRDTDEVFEKIVLEPVDEPSALTVHRSPVPVTSSLGGNDSDFTHDEDKIVPFAKVLTPSDANNGGGFSVPRYCADSIFPPLNYKVDPPVQTISVRDVHGVVWEFRHIYRGTPRRHLLTTGWSKFVNHKKLVAGDSVIFMRNRSDELFVGLRRTVRSSGNVDCGKWSSQMGATAAARVKLEEEFGSGGTFSRSTVGRVSARSVVQAAKLAAADMPFEVVYYPRAGSPDFMVKAETVKHSLNVVWTAGMRVKMPVETEDSSRKTWVQGTVSTAAIPDHGQWCGSPWRMLQVTWDEPEVLHNVKRVNPWQVEFIAATPLFPPIKKLRVPQKHELLTGEEGDLFFPLTGLTSSVMGKLSPSLLNYNFPAGMQGARHDPFCVSSFSNILTNNTHNVYGDHLFGNMELKSDGVSTELSIGTSLSDNLSPHSQSSVHFFGTEITDNRAYNPSTKNGISFRLFGKIIQTQQPAEGGYTDVGSTEDDSSKEYSMTKDINNALDLSLPYAFKNLYNKLDEMSKGSAVEACSL